MLFSDDTKVWKNFSPYLKDTRIISAELSKIIVDRNVFPEDCSAVGKNKVLLVKKLFSEYYERRTLGFNSFSKRQTFVISQEDVTQIHRSEIGYGYSKRYGFLDTTGTSAGNSTLDMKDISLRELIEKNECLLFWYTNRYKTIVKNKQLYQIIRKLGMDVPNLEVFLFYMNELSTAHTVIVFCFYNGILISTGSSCSKKYNTSLRAALLEAKMIMTVYYGRNVVPIDRLRDSLYQKDIYGFIQDKYSQGKKVLFRKIKDTPEIVLAKWIDDVEFVMIDMIRNSRCKGIRCCSKKLINCLPYREYLRYMPDKAVMKKYDIYSKLESIPECLIY